MISEATLPIRSDIVGRIWRAVPAGMLGGLAFGLGLRISMRVAALAEGLELELTAAGTFFILLLGAVLGAVFGPIAVVVGGLWREHPIAGATLAAVPLGLGFVVLASGSEIADIGHPLVNIASFGSAAGALGFVAAVRARRSPTPDAKARVRGAIVVGSVVATAVGFVVTMPALAWVLDRTDGGTQMHPALPGWRDPRIGDLGEAVGAVLGAAMSGVFVGLLVGMGLVAMRRRVASSDRPVQVITTALAVVAACLLLLPEGPRTMGNTAVIAAGLVAMVPLIARLAVRLSGWLEPSALGTARRGT